MMATDDPRVYPHQSHVAVGLPMPGNVGRMWSWGRHVFISPGPEPGHKVFEVVRPDGDTELYITHVLLPREPELALDGLRESGQDGDRRSPAKTKPEGDGATATPHAYPGLRGNAPKGNRLGRPRLYTSSESPTRKHSR